MKNVILPRKKRHAYFEVKCVASLKPFASPENVDGKNPRKLDLTENRSSNYFNIESKLVIFIVDIVKMLCNKIEDAFSN